MIAIACLAILGAEPLCYGAQPGRFILEVREQRRSRRADLGQFAPLIERRLEADLLHRAGRPGVAERAIRVERFRLSERSGGVDFDLAGVGRLVAKELSLPFGEWGPLGPPVLESAGLSAEDYGAIALGSEALRLWLPLGLPVLPPEADSRVWRTEHAIGAGLAELPGLGLKLVQTSVRIGESPCDGGESCVLMAAVLLVHGAEQWSADRAIVRFEAFGVGRAEHLFEPGRGMIDTRGELDLRLEVQELAPDRSGGPVTLTRLRASFSLKERPL